MSENNMLSKFKGYDPYDLAEASINLPQTILAKLSFINKVSPINFRRVLGIKATDNSKSNGLWLWAYSLSGNDDYDKEIEFLLNWVDENKATEFEEFSMGFSFKMALSRYTSGPGKTSLIISLFIVFPMIELFKKTKDKNLLEKIISFESLLENHWLKFETSKELWYSYLPKHKDEVYNATAKIGKFYSLLYSIEPKHSYRGKIEKILQYLLSKQNADGSWGYSVNAPYVDNFHTAFVLDSIHHMRQLVDNENYKRMFEMGLGDYIKNCFTLNFKPLHFHKINKPKDIRSRILDVEIRDSANAIILFSKLGMKMEADQILFWTENNLFHKKKNYYYFFKNKLFTNRIKFVRWQAWMALAKAEYKIAFHEEN